MSFISALHGQLYGSKRMGVRKRYSFRIVSGLQYKTGRVLHMKEYPPLSRYISDQTQLLILSADDGTVSEEEVPLIEEPQTIESLHEEVPLYEEPQNIESLNEELGHLYQILSKANLNPGKTRVKEKIDMLLKHVWPQLNLEVAIFGSSANGLAFENSDVDLCIVVPDRTITGIAQNMSKLKKSKTVFNMRHLASKLQDIGMTHVEAIATAKVPICKFTDPETGLQCDINTDNQLGIKNTRLIKEYIRLDDRIPVFLYAIKYFTKQKDISNSKCGTLSSYAYIIMALHFLMNACEKPVIPCLQQLDEPCHCTTCAYQSEPTIYRGNDGKQHNVGFHTCVVIMNEETGKFSRFPDNGDQLTCWRSHNTDSVAALLIQFFRWVTNIPSTKKVISIRSLRPVSVYSIQKFNQQSTLMIQDPFIEARNVA
ncbi:hypothetical protein BDB01DRAFT_379722 [Pilobolus umbonatus]|nr:hypothetical protein BDB01DRAFT_379722 [Pilobolus umbonatus]